ncbi:MAG: OmpA family protein [Deltaproteobacteria bacterium]|nr:OmpA family protein [Deltaproteobacteria bacterium]
MKKNFFIISIFGTLLSPVVSHAATSFDTISFKPASDHGYYLTVEQSQTLKQWNAAIGAYGEFSRHSFQGVIDKQATVTVGGAVGLMDWLSLGATVTGVPHQQFFSPTTGAEETKARWGDVTLNLKGRIVDNEVSPIGIALVPFVTIPSGDDEHFVGNGKVTGGGKLVVDTARIADFLSFSINVGGQAREAVTLPGTRTINDQFIYGAAVNARILKPVQLIAEVQGWTTFDDFFKQGNRPVEMNGAVRFLTSDTGGLAITAGGGGRLNDDGPGTPEWRVFGGLSYRTPTEEREQPEPIVETPPPRPTKEVIRSNNIYFATGKATITSASLPALDELFSEVQGRSDVKHIHIEGHTDSVGDDDSNLKLSEARANAIRTFFIKKGYPSEKISASGMGEASPIADNDSKEGRSQNRRVEFHLELQPGSNTVPGNS